MSGIKDLDILLSNIEPILDKDEFIFCTFPDYNSGQLTRLQPIGFFKEKEGITFIITKESAISEKISFDSTYCLISLNVHSSLEAVGLTAAVSTKLAEKNISANVVAAYYHDHIFIPADKAEQAMKALIELQK